MLSHLEQKVFNRLLNNDLGMNFEGCQVKIGLLELDIETVYKTIDNVSKRYD